MIIISIIDVYKPDCYTFINSTLHLSHIIIIMSLLNIIFTLLVFTIVNTGVHAQMGTCTDPPTNSNSSLEYRADVIEILFNTTVDSYPYTSECFNLSVVSALLNQYQDARCRTMWVSTSSLIQGCSHDGGARVCYDHIPAPECACLGTKKQAECVMLALSNLRRSGYTPNPTPTPTPTPSPAPPPPMI